MSAGAIVFDRLHNQTSAANRVYPTLAPEDAPYPRIVYQQISAVRMHAMGQDGPLVRVRMQVSAWGKTYADTQTLAAEVRARLNRFRGIVDGTQVQDVLLDNELDDYSPEAQARRVIQDYTLFTTE